jgi:hypothetical protein
MAYDGTDPDRPYTRPYTHNDHKALMTALAILAAILWTAGSIGGTWYLAHRIDVEASEPNDGS